MESPTKNLINEILAIQNTSLNKLAREVGLMPSTLSRILSGKTKFGMTNTYMKIMRYKKRIMVIDKFDDCYENAPRSLT